MNILYDLVYLEKETQGGISKMWLEYFKLIKETNFNISFIKFNQSQNYTSKYLQDKNYYNFNTINQKFIFNKLFFKIGFIRNLFLLKLIPKNINIFHSTDYINPIFKRKNLKIVTTIHDMVFWEQKNKFSKNLDYWDKVWTIYHSLKISDVIITVSNTSKKINC